MTVDEILTRYSEADLTNDALYDALRKSAEYIESLEEEEKEMVSDSFSFAYTENLKRLTEDLFTDIREGDKKYRKKVAISQVHFLFATMNLYASTLTKVSKKEVRRARMEAIRCYKRLGSFSKAAAKRKNRNKPYFEAFTILRKNIIFENGKKTPDSPEDAFLPERKKKIRKPLPEYYEQAALVVSLVGFGLTFFSGLISILLFKLYVYSAIGALLGVIVCTTGLLMNTICRKRISDNIFARNGQLFSVMGLITGCALTVIAPIISVIRFVSTVVGIAGTAVGTASGIFELIKNAIQMAK